LRHVAERFPHIQLHPDVWLTTSPQARLARIFL
jgi:hypothetical protein